MISILDSGFLYAHLDESDEHHDAVYAVMRDYRGRILLLITAITETAYLLQKRCGIKALASFLESIESLDYELTSPDLSDYLRSAEILRKYNDANIDFVDSCIVAMAERLNITTILTVDRRHFSIFKPRHCESFEILP